MANIYVRSTDGNDADSGATWALAKAKLAGADAIDAAGDTIFVSQVHAETTSGAHVSWAWAGTDAAPTKIICGNDAAEPPTAVTTGATVGVTGADFNLRLGGNMYCEGIQFNAGSGANTSYLQANYSTGNYVQRYVNCNLYLSNSSYLSIMSIGANNLGDGPRTTLTNCNFKFGHADQQIQLRGEVHIVGGSIASGGTSLTYLFHCNSAGVAVKGLVEGFSFANFSAGFHLILAPSKIGSMVIRGCTMPAGWTGSLVSSAITCPSFRAEMYDCTNATTTWPLWIEDYCGSIKAETTLVRTGSLAPYSLKMTSNAKASEAFLQLKSNEIFLAVGTPGSAQTATFEILHDSVTNLTDGEIWVEVEYRDTSGSRRSVEITDHRATALTTAADQTASSATWTTTGLTNPNKQALAVTFTPQVAGYSVARIVLAKPSKTVYVDQDSGVV